MRGVGGILVVALLTMGASPAAAGHGHPYLIEGTACHDATGCFDATLEWSGGGLGGAGTFRVTLYGVLPDGPPLTLAVPGREEFRNIEGGETATCDFVETYDYRGSDAHAGGNGLEVAGPLSNCLDEDVYHGTLRGHFAIFAVTFAFPHPEPEML